MWRLTVPGEPVAKVMHVHRGHAHRSPKTKKYMQLVRTLAEKTQAKDMPWDGPIALTILAYRSIPKSWSKRKRASAALGDTRPLTRGDLSNYVKGIEDALNGVAFLDDSQIVEYGAVPRDMQGGLRDNTGKYYDDGHGPRVEIIVERWRA